MNSKMRKVLTCQCEHEAISTHSRTFAVVSRKPLNNRNLSHIKTFEMNKNKYIPRCRSYVCCNDFVLRE